MDDLFLKNSGENFEIFATFVIYSSTKRRKKEEDKKGKVEVEAKINNTKINQLDNWLKWEQAGAIECC